MNLTDSEIEKLLEYEGLDFGDEIRPDEIWSESKHRTIFIDLRFCNIVDGYIPLVKEIRAILPPLADGGTVEVSWQDNPESWFVCKVSKTKRAIYNFEQKLKQIFGPLPSGVRLYITRLGPCRYRLHLNRRPHVVRNLKVFVSDGLGGWKVEFHDAEVEWETGDEVFRHQLTFQQMEALHDEARRKKLSVRDAVYDVMKLLAQSERVHVRTVYDAVFLWVRTCSLAAVWAQFRQEHECYVREAPGWYRFDPSKPLPRVRFAATAPQPREAMPRLSKLKKYYPARARPGREWKFQVFRSRLDDYRSEEDACLVVFCEFGSEHERRFIIPISFLEREILTRAFLDERGRYTFAVSKNTFIFTWQHGVHMDGKQFLDESDFQLPDGAGGFTDYV